MGEQAAGESTPTTYAFGVANGSYDWYAKAAIKARRFHRLSECLHLVISAAVPVAAVMIPGDAKIPAVLGTLIVIITGFRSVFHWQDDYLRFSAAREAVEMERRLYVTGSPPYDDVASRDRRLAAAITRIEHHEMDNWLQIAAPRSESDESK